MQRRQHCVRVVAIVSTHWRKSLCMVRFTIRIVLSAWSAAQYCEWIRTRTIRVCCIVCRISSDCLSRKGTTTLLSVLDSTKRSGIILQWPNVFLPLTVIVILCIFYILQRIKDFICGCVVARTRFYWLIRPPNNTMWCGEENNKQLTVQCLFLWCKFRKQGKIAVNLCQNMRQLHNNT